MSAQRAMQDFSNAASSYAGTEGEISNYIDEKKDQLQTKFRGAVSDKISSVMFGNEISQEQKERLEEVSGMAIPLAASGGALYKKVKGIRAAKAARSAKLAEGSNGSGAAGGDAATADEAGGAAANSGISSAGADGATVASRTATGTSQSAAAGSEGSGASSASAESGGGFEAYGGGSASGASGAGAGAGEAGAGEASGALSAIDSSVAVPGVAASRVGSINSGGLLGEQSSGLRQGRLLRSGQRLGWNRRANYGRGVTVEESAPARALAPAGRSAASSATDLEGGLQEGAASLASRASSAVSRGASVVRSAYGSARSAVSSAQTTATTGMDASEQSLVQGVQKLKGAGADLAKGAGEDIAEGAGEEAATVGVMDVLGPIGLAAGIGLTLYDVFTHSSDKKPPPTPAAPASVMNPYTTSSFSTGNLVLPSKSAVLDQTGGHAAF